jgi:hypothetical protein
MALDGDRGALGLPPSAVHVDLVGRDWGRAGPYAGILDRWAA